MSCGGGVKPSSLVESGLVAPAFQSSPEFHHTYGPEVSDLGVMVGYAPDPEQRLALDLLFAVDKRGMSTAFEFGIICARQNLKTGLLKLAALGWLFLMDQQLMVWSAHEFSTTKEAHLDLTRLIEGNAFLSRRVKQIYNSAADKSIELMSGARLIFKARTHAGGIGLSGWKVILDEGFALQGSHIAAILPTLSAMPDPQVVYASSAGHAESEVLRGVRDRGRAGSSDRLAYLEWCAPVGGCALDLCEHVLDAPGCALDRSENWAAANPLLGRRRANGTGLTAAHIRSEREAMATSLELRMKFARERLGWWDEPGAAEVFGPGKWEATGGDTPSGVELEVIAVAVAEDLAHAAIVGAGRAGQRVYVQVLAHGPGFDWVPELLPTGVPIVIDATGPAASLIPVLSAQRPKLTVEVVRRENTLDAYDEFFTLVIDGVLLQDRDPLLNTAVNGAVPRFVGDRTTWGRRKSTSDISPLEGATLAAWWVTLPAAPMPLPPAPPQVATSSPRNDLMTAGF